mgnify:CR=1 FL=1
MPVDVEDWGPVLVTSGRYKGRVGYYDDDNDGKAIVYFPPKHSLTSAKAKGYCVSLIGSTDTADIAYAALDSGTTDEDKHLMLALVAPKEYVDDALFTRAVVGRFVAFMQRLGYAASDTPLEELDQQLAALEKRLKDP